MSYVRTLNISKGRDNFDIMKKDEFTPLEICDSNSRLIVAHNKTCNS
jgi:hypothetical protein